MKIQALIQCIHAYFKCKNMFESYSWHLLSIIVFRLISDTTDEDVDFTLPPPPAEPEKRGTLYIVEDFKPDFLILPEPPPEHILNSQPQHFLHVDEFPELPPAIPPLPPPLPVDLEVKMNQETPKTFADMISSNAFKLTSSTNQDKNPQMGRQSSSGKGDSRNELLSAIRNGELVK